MNKPSIEIHTIQQFDDLDMGHLFALRFALEASQDLRKIPTGDRSRLKTLRTMFEGVRMGDCTPANVEALFDARQRGEVNPSNRIVRSLVAHGTKVMSKQERYRQRQQGRLVDDDVPRKDSISERTIYKEHRLFKATVLEVAPFIMAPVLASKLHEMYVFTDHRLGENKSVTVKVLDQDMTQELWKQMPSPEMRLVMGLTLSNLWNVKQILGLKWSDVDLDASTAHVSTRVDHAKNGEKIKVPLSQQTVTLLRSWSERTQGGSMPAAVRTSAPVVPISGNVVKDTFRRVADSLGLTTVNLNHVRDYAHERLLEQGFTVDELRWMSGAKE